MWGIYLADGWLCFIHTVSEVKMAKYFSVTVDWTPDVLHVDNLTSVRRYVSPEGHSQKHILRFLPIQIHAREALFESVRKVLEEKKIYIANGRGIWYDNVKNMSGMYKLFSDFSCHKYKWWVILL